MSADVEFRKRLRGVAPGIAGPRLAGAAAMDQDPPVDYYDTLQVSTSAEPETIHRVYRLLAQRFHPDNAQTGNEGTFRQIAAAYAVLSDPEKRAKYDLVHERQRQERWRFVARGNESDEDFSVEQRVRLTILEVLCTKRRTEPNASGLFLVDLEKLVGRAREQLEFTMWYLAQKKLVHRTDNSSFTITADGVDYLEQNYQSGNQARRLRAVNS
jgi:curved DNA-binding protein CbpA